MVKLMIIKCKRCNKEFETKYSRKKYCNYCNEIIEMVCKCGCKEAFKTLRKNLHIRKYIQHHCSEEVCKKMSKAHKGKKFSKEHCEKIREINKGRKHTKETRLNMSIAHIGIPHPHSKKAKENMSKAAMLRFIKYKQKSGNTRWGNHGHFYSKKNKQEIYYASSLEYSIFKILEQLSKVKSYEVHPFGIKYKLNNEFHYYIPDILVSWDDGTKELIEVKPEWLLNNKIVQIKAEAARKYCKQNNMTYNFWTENNFIQ